MKTYNLDDVQEKIIGKRGTARRDKFENELQMDLTGNTIKLTRRERDQGLNINWYIETTEFRT